MTPAQPPPPDDAANHGPAAVPLTVGTTPMELDGAPIPLRQRTVSGFAWVAVSAVSNKFIGFAAQLVLARWLTHDDFGLIALALAAATFAMLLREAGVIQVLVQRGNGFDEWAGPAFGLVTFLCTMTGVLLAVMARPLAHFYGEPRLVPMLYVIAATCPLSGLGNVAVARLEHELRFRDLGLIATVATAAQYLIQTILAVTGFGAMSYVWGILLSTALRLAWLWTLCRPRVERFLDVRAWKALLGDSIWVLGVAVFGTMVNQYDRIVLGKAADLATVGLYFFALNLTTQTSQMLSGTLSNVLFPALSRLSDQPERQRKVFLESARMLTCVATPLCILQAVLAEPFLAIFGPQWRSAVSLVQILSVGMAFVVCGAPATALLNSQGRFRGFFFAQVTFTSFNLLFVSIAAFGWPHHAALAVAIAVSAYYCIFGPVGVQLAVRNWRPPWTESLHIFGPGTAVSAAGVVVALPALIWLDYGPYRWVTSGVLYCVAATAWLAWRYPSDSGQLFGMARSLVCRRRATPA